MGRMSSAISSLSRTILFIQFPSNIYSGVIPSHNPFIPMPEGIVENRFQLRWDEEELARAFKVTTKDVREYLTDGRRVSFIIERRLMWENEGWKLAPSEGAGYDLLDPDGGMWEVRSITRQGVYFNPSNKLALAGSSMRTASS